MQGNLIQLRHIARQQPIEQSRLFGAHSKRMQGRKRNIETLLDVEPIAFRVAITRIETDNRSQMGQKPQVKIGQSLLHDIEGGHRIPHKFKEGIVAFALAHQTIDHLGQEDSHRRTAHIKRDTAQQKTAPHLPKAVHLATLCRL